MRLISTRAHGMLDWVMGPVLVALPFTLGSDQGRPEGLVLLVIGIAMVLLTVFTDYEFGLVRSIPVPTHLAIDAASGALLAISPWLFHFSHRIWLPHVLLGVVELGASLTTRRQSSNQTFRSYVSRA
jgi:hypothetical protein